MSGSIEVQACGVNGGECSGLLSQVVLLLLSNGAAALTLLYAAALWSGNPCSLWLARL
jgi:hypothetical protein